MVATYNSMPGTYIHVKDAHTMATNDVGTISPNRSTLVSVTRARAKFPTPQHVIISEARDNYYY
jgi:hypothetical protein